MRSVTLSAVLLAASFLSGCGEAPETAAPAAHRGRYHGIGTYAAGRMWSRMVAEAQQRSPSAATLADDEQVIVVVDSHSGEVRQCGNLSGHCIAMNPWSASLTARQAAPVQVREHAADLDRAAEQAEAGGPLANASSVRPATEAARPVQQ
jgi:hypothetical protein